MPELDHSAILLVRLSNFSGRYSIRHDKVATRWQSRGGRYDIS